MTAAVPVDVDALPLTQGLVMEVLAARDRLGERMWPFPNSAKRALDALEALGLVGHKDGVVERTRNAWLTEQGRASVQDPSYVPPALRGDCLAMHHSPRIPGHRGGDAVCGRRAGHAGAHEGVVGRTAYCWRDETEAADACYCGEPADLGRVHRAHACEPWSTAASGDSAADRP